MSETIGETLRKAIDRHYYENQQDKPRSHLGFSVLGKECPREIWYSWRWFVIERHLGRMLRLFSRGHAEEQKIIDHFAAIGAVVQPVDPATGKQWLASDFGGHVGGSSDGRISNLDRFGLPGTGLLECKTSNDKNFKLLREKGVLTAKPTHYVQMQLYMAYFDLPWAVYAAVNKNDDELYIEVVTRRIEIAKSYRDRAQQIMESKAPPKRISENSGFFKCRMCPAHDICHHPEENTPPKNCRTCVNSWANLEEGLWICSKFNVAIPPERALEGCLEWERRA